MALFKLSFIVCVFAVLFGYILNFSAFKYNICKRLVENTFRERCIFNKKVLCLIYEDGSKRAFGSNDECDATIIIKNENNFFEKMLLSFPAVALGEAYVLEYWDTEDDLGDVITLFSTMSFNRNPNEAMAKRYIRGFIKYGIDLLSISKWTDYYQRTSLTTKTQSEDKQSISHHYDKSNDFYKLFLDKTMVYSCAIFDDQHGIDSLNSAQDNKLSILIDKMNVKKKNAKILDIGSGWGYTASYFANKSAEYDVHVDGITLSKEQLKFSQTMYKKQIYAKVIDFKYKDYRSYLDVSHKNYFDGIISIGMLEHVHLKRLDEFFNVTSHILKEDGMFGLHYITRNDIYPLNTDINNGFYPFDGVISRSKGCDMVTFVSKYIFPGGCLLLSDWVHESAMKHGLVQLHKEFYGLHYAKTLAIWRANFNKNWKENLQGIITSQPYYDKYLYKTWNFYLANCEAAFRTQYVDLVQQVFVKKTSGNMDVFRKMTNVNQQIPV